MAKILRGISTSDWHLSGGLSNVLGSQALTKQLFEIEKVFKYAIENDIRKIFMAGDISDKARLDEETLIALIAMMLKYDKYLQFRYILGNHDFAQVGKTAIDVLKVFAENGGFKNVFIYDKPTVEEIDGIEVGFVPFPHKQLDEKSDRPRLMFAHIEEAGAIGDNGRPLKVNHLKLLRDKRDYVFSGHLHTYQEMKDRRICFNGSPYQKNFGEQGKKGFVEFKAKYGSDRELLVKRTFVDTRPEFTLINLAINEDKDFNQIECNENLLYKVSLGEGVVAPKGLTKDFPNIVMLNGVSYKGRSNLDTAARMDANDMPKITPLTGLVKYLKKYELEKGEIKRAVGMVKEAIQEVNNGWTASK